MPNPFTIREINEFVPRTDRDQYSLDPAENTVLGNIRLLLEELEDVPDRSGSLKTDRMFLNNVLDAADGKLPENKGDLAVNAIGNVIHNIYQNQVDNRNLDPAKRDRIRDLTGHVAAGLPAVRQRIRINRKPSFSARPFGKRGQLRKPILRQITASIFDSADQFKSRVPLDC